MHSTWLHCIVCRCSYGVDERGKHPYEVFASALFAGNAKICAWAQMQKGEHSSRVCHSPLLRARYTHTGVQRLKGRTRTALTGRVGAMADPTAGQNERPAELPWWPVPRGRAVSAPNTRTAKVHCSVLLWHRSCKHTHMRANAHARGRAHPHTCTRR